MKITSVARPDVQGRTPEQAVRVLCDQLHKTNVQVMELNNRIVDLETAIKQLRQGR